MLKLALRSLDWSGYETVLKATGYMFEQDSAWRYLDGFYETRIEKGEMMLAPGQSQNPETDEWEGPPIYDDVYCYVNVTMRGDAYAFDYVGPRQPISMPTDRTDSFNIWEWSQLGTIIHDSAAGYMSYTTSKRQTKTHEWFATPVAPATKGTSTSGRGSKSESPDGDLALIWPYPEVLRFEFPMTE